MTPHEAWAVLALTPTTDWSAVERRYRELARAHHPDLSPADAKLFAEINAAHDVLRDAFENRPARRPLSDFEEEMRARANATYAAPRRQRPVRPRLYAALAGVTVLGAAAAFFALFKTAPTDLRIFVAFFAFGFSLLGIPRIGFRIAGSLAWVLTAVTVIALREAGLPAFAVLVTAPLTVHFAALAYIDSRRER
ncbi:J domain-containing protein [Gryllotalpicola kribbensis]|uniref:J domain-containing protein n=1 Tax=Gryllotalpicola kribbensis TaxID=993084 RepID=UPI0031CF582F